MMRYSIVSTSTFTRWVTKLKDRQAKKVIAMRLVRAEAGHFGDIKSVSDAISEMRIFAGPGYRIYSENTPPLAAGTRRWGIPKGERRSSRPFGRGRGFIPRPTI